jgi:hypothetical protein
MAKTAYPKTNAEKAKLYLHTMVEVKERLHVTLELLGMPIAPLFRQELCYLELRYICELIAIACLAAQGDYATQRSFTESYKPPEIFNALRKFYPDFFPLPAERIITDLGDKKHHHIDYDHRPDAYREADVTALWQSAGQHLHRASVKKYLRSTFENGPPNLDGIAAHVSGLARLLDSHIIPIQHDKAKDVKLLVEMGQRHENSRLLFLNFNYEAGTIDIENYTAGLQG